jgi:hypothetical protein
MRRERVAAEFIGSSPRTLQRWRGTGEGPGYVRLGKRRVAYTRAELLNSCRPAPHLHIETIVALASSDSVSFKP